MTDAEKKTGMTDAECEYWDNYYSNNTFEPGPNLLKEGVKPGFAHNALLLSELAPEVAEYLRAQSKAFQKSQSDIINDLVREKLTAGAWATQK